MRTTLYLIRHARPEPGDGLDPGLAPAGRRQAECTRDFLAVRPIDACYSAPVRRSVETAAAVADPHGLRPQLLADLGPDATPAQVRAAYDQVLAAHPGQGIVVVAPGRIHRAYVAALLGLPAAAPLPLDPCGLSIVTCDGTGPRLATLNATFHLNGVPAVPLHPAAA